LLLHLTPRTWHALGSGAVHVIIIVYRQSLLIADGCWCGSWILDYHHNCHYYYTTTVLVLGPSCRTACGALGLLVSPALCWRWPRVILPHGK